MISYNNDGIVNIFLSKHSCKWEYLFISQRNNVNVCKLKKNLLCITYKLDLIVL